MDMGIIKAVEEKANRERLIAKIILEHLKQYYTGDWTFGMTYEAIKQKLGLSLSELLDWMGAYGLYEVSCEDDVSPNLEILKKLESDLRQ